jgi:nitrate reductase delta subunit
MAELQETVYLTLAEAFRYPDPGLVARLQAGLAGFPPGAGRKAFETFLRGVGALGLGEWEELYTHSLDLSPAVAPYLGYQMWGDGYARGTFMAALNRAYHAAGIEAAGELPDHLGVVLAYLGSGAQPPQELVDIFDPALQKMLAVMHKAESKNPYTRLLEAVAELVDLQTAQPA